MRQPKERPRGKRTGNGDENDKLKELKNVVAGKLLAGQVVAEVKSGVFLRRRDYIAFPYKIRRIEGLNTERRSVQAVITVLGGIMLENVRLSIENLVTKILVHAS